MCVSTECIYDTLSPLKLTPQEASLEDLRSQASRSEKTFEKQEKIQEAELLEESLPEGFPSG